MNSDSYDNLNTEEKEQYHAQVIKDIEPFEEMGVVTRRKEDFGGRPIWKTSVSPALIMGAIELAKEKKGDPNSLLINGQKVLLNFMPFLLFLNNVDKEAHQKLEEYVKNLMNDSLNI